MEEKQQPKNEVVRVPNPSSKHSEEVLMVWIKRMSEHYRLSISKINAEVYREFLSDLSGAEIDAGFRRAMANSEFPPTVATIRNAIRDLQGTEPIRSTLIRYPEVSPEDRALTPEMQKIMDDLKVKLGIGEYVKKVDAPVKIFTPKSAPLSFEKQKEELRRRGWMK